MTIQQTSESIKTRSALFSDIVAACKKLLEISSLAEEARLYADKRASSFNQKKFDFGFFPKEEDLGQLIELVGEKTLEKLGLIYPWYLPDRTYTIKVNKGSLSNHNLIIPIKDDYGYIVALVGRTLLSDEKQKELNIQKYKYTQFTKSLYLFGLHQAKKAIRNSDSVVLVEGQIDCITCHAHGFHNVVALGGSSLSCHQFYLLNKYTDNIYLLLDNDPAGNKAREKIIKRYSQISHIRQIHLPEGYKDIDEYLHKSSNYNVLNDLT